jgi:hypothetical protein
MDARSKWLQLLGLLNHMIQETERPIAKKMFHSLGPQRLSTAQRQLRHEQQRLLAAATRLDVAIEPDAIVQATNALTLYDDLVQDYLSLAEAYQLSASVARQRGETELMAWMNQRARLHIEHSRFLSS